MAIIKFLYTQHSHTIFCVTHMLYYIETNECEATCMPNMHTTYKAVRMRTQGWQG